MQACKGLDAQAYTYFLGMYSEGKNLFQSRVAFFAGKDKELFKKRFITDPRIRFRRQEGDQLVYALSASEVSHVEALDRNVFFVKPVIVKDGCAHWTVASWEKRNLNRLYLRLKRIGPTVRVELLSLNRGSLNLFLPHALAGLTSLQKRALELCVEEGYYDYPRRMDLSEIAAKHGFARTTLQSHLRKAEKKALRALTAQLNF